jgi:hypothetical protein
MIKDMLPKGWRMGSSTPQEGGTTDEEYYGQPQQMLNGVVWFTAPKKAPSISPEGGEISKIEAKLHFGEATFLLCNPPSTSSG